MKKEDAGKNKHKVNNGKTCHRWYAVREAVIGVVLMAAFLIPFLSCYLRETSEVPVISLVSENQLLNEAKLVSEVALYSRGAVLMDAATGRVLYGKNENTVMPMASTTKIMTCILALESGRLDELAQVSAYAAAQPKVHAGLRSGEQYYIRDLLYSMMLESHNDAAVVIAEHIGGSVEGFADLMNRKAAELGMNQTYFITPNGLDAEDENGIHATTARDLAVLCAYAIKNDTFCEIVQTPSYQYHDAEGIHRISANNKDAFLHQMTGALGIKTGFTGQAGFCFAGALEDRGRVYVSVVLAAGWPPNKNYKWIDTSVLMHYGMEHYENREISVPSIQGVSCVTGGSALKTAWEFPADSMAMLLGDCDTVEIVTLYPEEIHGGIVSGEQIGLRRVMVNGECYGMQRLWQRENVEAKNFRYCADQILEQFLP